MTLFDAISKRALFRTALETFFGGAADQATLAFLADGKSPMSRVASGGHRGRPQPLRLRGNCIKGDGVDTSTSRPGALSPSPLREGVRGRSPSTELVAPPPPTPPRKREGREALASRF